MSKIACRHCTSPDCKGCNLYRLEDMLNSGKLDAIMNKNRAIVDVRVRPDIEAEWVYRQSTGGSHCSNCGGLEPARFERRLYCGTCGARMKNGY